MSSKGKEVITEGEEEVVVAITEGAEGSSSSQTKKTVTLVSSDEVKFEVDVAIANQSETIKNLILDVKDDDDEFVVPLLNVTGVLLAKVIEYWKQHAEVEDVEQLAAFDKEFVNMSKELLFEAVVAANFLESRALLELLCKTIADIVKTMSVEEVREYFSVECDFTEEEERQIRAENQWAFDQ